MGQFFAGKTAKKFCKRSQVETPRHLNPSQLRLTNQVAFSHPFCCVS
jgi:hypothetical protein